MTRILLGRIKAAHGIRGEVLVTSFADVPEDVAAYGPLASKDGKRHFELSVIRVTPKGVVVRIKGVNDRNAVEALRGTELYVARDQLPAPEDGVFYHSDLIGLDAVAPDGTAIGHIIAVDNFGAGDLVEIRLAGSNKTEFVPFTDACVPSVDLVASRVTVVLPTPSDTDGPDAERDPDEGPQNP
ncbi:MAG: ribosome maturation factor RimM [Hyphomicrobiaceae bacterium]